MKALVFRRWTPIALALTVWVMAWFGVAYSQTAPASIAQGAAVQSALEPHSALAGVDDEIVYIDGGGFIRVHDPQPVGERQTVQWISPIAGWTDLVLLDVNGDGDMEIAAIGGGERDGRLVVYDPVVSATNRRLADFPMIAGIPWEMLFEIRTPGKPVMIAAGDLDPSTAGSELIYAYNLNEEEIGGGPSRQRFYAYRRLGAMDGREWQHFIDLASSDRWTQVVVGNLDGRDAHEVVLVKADTGVLAWYRVVNNDLVRFQKLNSDNKPWWWAAIGWFNSTNNRMQLAALRDAPFTLPSLIVFELRSDDSLREIYKLPLEPSPTFSFFFDIDGNGDDELAMMRAVPATVLSSPRLFVRNFRDGLPFTLEEFLDNDNGYKAGAGGDFDGDGKDEIAIVRNNRMRIYLSPESSNFFAEVNTTTDSRTVRTGDLDRNGYLQELRLAVSATLLQIPVAAGERTAPFSVQVTNATDSTPLPFAWSVSNNPAWLTVTADRSTTAATLAISVDASRLPEGSYSSLIQLTSVHPQVLQTSVAIQIQVVVAAGVIVTPQDLYFLSDECASAPPTVTQTLSLSTRPATSYFASILADMASQHSDFRLATPDLPTPSTAPGAASVTWPSAVPWAGATSPTASAPESISVTVDFGLRTGEAAGATLVVVATVLDAQQVRTVPIILQCVTSRVYLPMLISK